MQSSPHADQADPLRTLIEGTLKARGWSKRKLAQRSGLPETTVYSILDRHRRHYTVRQSTLDKLATGLGIPVTTLMLALGDMLSEDEVLTRLLEIWRELTIADRVRVLELAEKRREATKPEKPSSVTGEGFSDEGDARGQ